MALATERLTFRRDWRAALGAVRRLLADANDTAQVFRVMRALNADTARSGYARLVGTIEGGRIAYEQVELAALLADPAYVARFPAGSVGAAYAGFLRETGHSADGLATISRTDDFREARHPYAWFGRRMRDMHDIWHVLTGYRGDEPLGEVCLVAFSYAQTRGLGWALIAVATALKALRRPRGGRAVRAIWEGYRHGRAAHWLPGEDVEALLSEPLAAARARLGISEPVRYEEARRTFGTGLAA